MTILLLPDTPGAAAVVELLVSWSRSGLLRAFCIRILNDDPAASVQLIEDGQMRRTPLGDALRGTEPEDIEFVAFYPLPVDEELDPGFADAIEVYLAWARDNVLGEKKDDPIHCVLSVAPGDIGQHWPASVFRANWVNLLVAPEDRAAPGGVSQLIDETGSSARRFARHAAHAAATLASVWATPDSRRPDVLRQVDERLGPLQVQVRVVRCFSRIVELGYLADHVAATVFSPRGGWPRPGSEFERAADGATLATSAASAYLRRNADALLGRDFDPIVEPPPPKLNLVEAFMALIGQLWEYLTSRPPEWLDAARGHVHDAAAKRIEAWSRPTGLIRVRGWNEMPPEARSISNLRDRIENEEIPAEDGAVSSAWTELRQTTLGLIDGSPLPKGVEDVARGTAGRRLVLGDPALLAGGPPASSAADDDSDQESRQRPLLAQVQRAVLEAQRAAAARAAALRGPADDEEEAGEDGEADAGDGGSDSGLSGVRWLLRALVRLGLYSGAAVVAAVAAILLLPLAAAAGALVAIGIAWFFATAFMARAALMRRRLAEDEEAARELAELNRCLARIQAEGDAKRLQRRLAELEGWTAILTELVHRPWVREPFQGIDLIHTTSTETLPAACSIGIAPVDADLLEEVGKATSSRTFTPGWLAAIYRGVEEQAMSEYNLLHGEFDATPPDPTADTANEPDGQRNHLLTAVRRGDGRSSTDNPIAAELLEVLGKEFLDHLAPRVAPAADGARPLGPTGTWIEPHGGAEAIAAQHSQRLLGLRGWAASAVVVAPGVALAPASTVDRLVAVASPAEGRIEIEETRFPPESGLAVLVLESESQPEPVTTATGFRTGAGVVALEATADGVSRRPGFLVGDPGDPVIVYEGGMPAPGAAVFYAGSSELFAIHGEDGALHEVTDLDALIAAESGEAPIAANNGPAGPAPVKASDFLAALADENGAEAMLHGYWSIPDNGARRIDLALPPGLSVEQFSGRFGPLADSIEYMRPVRVMTHRVDLTAPVAPEELTACDPSEGG